MSTGASGQLRGDERALEALASAIRDWQRDARGLLVQADARLRAQADAVAGTRAQRANRLRALEAALRACPPDSPGRGQLMRDVRAAEEALASATAADQEMSDIRTEFQMLERQARASADGDAERADADLRRRTEAIKDYRAVAVPTSAPGLASGGGSPLSAGDALAQRGLIHVSLDQIDYGDNPILDGFTRGGANRGDYRWAVSTWADVVEPAVRDGHDRSYFEGRDAERGATGWRQTANVYDMFLGSDPIALSRRDDGTTGRWTPRADGIASRSLVNSGSHISR